MKLFFGKNNSTYSRMESKIGGKQRLKNFTSASFEYNVIYRIICNTDNETQSLKY